MNGEYVDEGPRGGDPQRAGAVAGAGSVALAEAKLPPGERLAFSVQETAEALGVCEKTIRRLVARGLLRPSRALRHLLIARREIERFLAETAGDGNS